LNEIEKKVAQFLRDNFSFVCFPVVTEKSRRHLENGIIVTINKTSEDFIVKD